MSKGKDLIPVLANLAKTDLAISEASQRGGRLRRIEAMKSLKAMYKNYANRNLLINNTVFSFNGEGICEVSNMGNTRHDFELLLKRPGVVDLSDEEAAMKVEVEDPMPIEHIELGLGHEDELEEEIVDFEEDLTEELGGPDPDLASMWTTEATDEE